jgi:hypothetical protein
MLVNMLVQIHDGTCIHSKNIKIQGVKMSHDLPNKKF